MHLNDDEYLFPVTFVIKNVKLQTSDIEIYISSSDKFPSKTQHEKKAIDNSFTIGE